MHSDREIPESKVLDHIYLQRQHRLPKFGHHRIAWNLTFFVWQVSNWVQKFCKFCGKLWRGNIDVEAYWCWEILNCNLLGPFSGQETQPPEVFHKEAILKNFAVFTGKHLCWSFFFIKPVTLLKRDSNTGVLLWILWVF